MMSGNQNTPSPCRSTKSYILMCFKPQIHPPSFLDLSLSFFVFFSLNPHKSDQTPENLDQAQYSYSQPQT